MKSNSDSTINLWQKFSCSFNNHSVPSLHLLFPLPTVAFPIIHLENSYSAFQTLLGMSSPFPELSLLPLLPMGCKLCSCATYPVYLELLLLILPSATYLVWGSMRLAAVGFHISVPGKVTCTGLVWRGKKWLLREYDPGAEGGKPRRLDGQNREPGRDFEKGDSKTQKILKRRLQVLPEQTGVEGKLETGRPFIHSLIFVLCSFTLCLSYRHCPHILGETVRGQQQTEKHHGIKERKTAI